MRCKRFQNRLVSVFSLFLPVFGPEAAELARYDFSGGNPSAAVMEQGVVGLDAQWVGVDGGFSFLGGNAYVNSAETSAVYDRDKYLTITITAEEGFVLNPDSFSFQLGGSRGSVGQDITVYGVVRSDVDLYASTIQLTPGPVMTAEHTFNTATPSYATFTADLSDPVYQGRNSLTFRLYGYDEVTSTGIYLRYDSLSIGGAVAPAGLRLVERDICVYGGTSGGVVAAVRAERLGKSAALLAFNRHLGGMTSGGLGMTDQGTRYTIGGISREFYQRVGEKYGMDEDFSFEPHIAEEVFEEMANEAGVDVFYGRRLASVTMDGDRIREITTDDGTVYRADMFIDATYEGDLMAAAGVSYTVGRESNDTYGETVNGVLVGGGPGGAVIDPYAVPGDPESGLIPMVQPHTPGAQGSADDLVQAYNFRMCLTQSPDRIPIAPPADYDAGDYELLARFIEALTPPLDLLDFMTLSNINNADTNSVNVKTDTNNRGGAISTDYVSGSWTYSDADHITRMELWAEHEDYMRGFFHFLATDSRVPATVRAEMQTWGLAADEFTDNGGWPNQLYVREARRMVSDYVMTEANSQGIAVPQDSIAMASYPNDSHTVAVIAVDGRVAVDGGLFVKTAGPYPVSYRSIVPADGECANLFSTFALSSSHVAFGSIRMEPVFMMLSHSAAVAACQAIDDGVDVQDVNYEKLKAQLLVDGQVLTLEGGDPNVVDNANPTKVEVTGAWTTSTATFDYDVNYFHDKNSLKGEKSVRFIPNIPSNGTYEVSMWWVSYSNRSTNTPVDIVHADGVSTVTVNQKLQGSQWVSLGAYEFESGTNGSVLVRTDGTDGYVIADAVRFLPAGSTGVEVNLWAHDAMAAEPLTLSSAAESGGFTVSRLGGDYSSPLVVPIVVNGSASNGVDYVALPSFVTIPAGQTAASVSVIPLADSVAEGKEFVLIALSDDEAYGLGALQNALIAVQDRPYDAWRHAHFSSAELDDEQISGDLADSDRDGRPNIVEALHGTDPRVADRSGSRQAFREQGGKQYLSLEFSKEKIPGLTVTADVAGNLSSAATWSSGVEHVEKILVGDDGTKETFRVRDLTPVDSADRRLVRIRVLKEE